MARANVAAVPDFVLILFLPVSYALGRLCTLDFEPASLPLVLLSTSPLILMTVKGLVTWRTFSLIMANLALAILLHPLGLALAAHKG